MLDMKKDHPFPNVIDCYRQVSNELSSKVAIVCNLEGPVTKAALLRGMENLAMDMHFAPDVAASYVRYATDLEHPGARRLALTVPGEPRFNPRLQSPRGFGTIFPLPSAR